MLPKSAQYLLDLTIALTQKELKTKYKSTSFGFLWIVINPIIQMIVLSIVFSMFLRIDVPDYPLFVFSGLLPWMFFTVAIQSATSSLITNRDLLKKITFPTILLPISSVIAHGYIFVLAFGIFIAFVTTTYGGSVLLLLLLPLILLQTVFSIALSLILSSLEIYYRDISFIVQAVIIPLFYATPIIYPLYLVPQKYSAMYSLNPMVGIITTYQGLVVDIRYFNTLSLLYSTIFSAVLLYLGYIIFTKRAKYFAEWI